MAWFKSIHAKLFIVTGLVTSGLTIMVAYTITNNSRKEMLEYSKDLAIETSQAVRRDIQERDEKFQDPRKIKEILESLAGADKSIDKIDVFKVEFGFNADTKTQITFVTSSADDKKVERWKPEEISPYLNTPNQNPSAEMIELVSDEVDPAPGKPTPTTKGWVVYLPISNPRPNKPPIGLVRTYCDLERWEVVWRNNLKRTYKILPLVLTGEFILLWVILGWLLSDPLKVIMAAMTRLEQGESSARANVGRKDELGRIAARFNLMATQLERASTEREGLIEEIRGLNASLQERIDEALVELQEKNQALEDLMERIAILREELGQQERLAVAGQLTAAFAHEVGTPLNLVNGHLQLLLSQPDLTDRARERLGTIQAQITRVGDIVRKLLGHTRRPQIRQEPLSLKAMVADLQRLWNPTLSSHHVVFECTAQEEDCTLKVDRKQMEQLFINLVNNAVDAMPEGGRIHLQVARDATSPKAQPRWDIILEDNGTGIAPDILPMVFKPMFTTKPEGKGTGLGLAICREIVRAHGGEIRIQSREGEGTKILFALPGA